MLGKNEIKLSSPPLLADLFDWLAHGPVSAPAQVWLLTSAPTTNYWNSIASSADGSKLASSADGSRLYLAFNGGGCLACGGPVYMVRTTSIHP